VQQITNQPEISSTQTFVRRFLDPVMSAASLATMSADPMPGPPGQEARFEAYVVPELEILYRVAQSITRNPTDAEDLVQDTLIRAYRAIERFDGRYPRAWLLTIMRNAQINRVRRKRPELMRDPDETMARVADESPDGADAESQLMDQEFEAPIEEALAALPEKFRKVVELVDLNQLSYQEAADALGIPVGTVMSRLHRARRNIRQHLEASRIEEI
jgi:RNA polymerase sigma-70 factor (ECF subfamily)